MIINKLLYFVIIICTTIISITMQYTMAGEAEIEKPAELHVLMREWYVSSAERY